MCPLSTRGSTALLLGWTLVSSSLPAIGDEASIERPIVKLHEGRLSGIVLDGVTAFRGIPYAAAPVGPLRWRPPQPPAPWPGIRKAYLVGAICPQAYNGADNGVGPLPMSEDCLTLNVYAPSLRPPAPLPVMFWIHGGGLVNGSATAALYDGTELARQGVVVVTINYRLGRLGFFAHPALSRERPPEPKANFGLMDQIAALQWVRRNIGAFGGDPGNVTIFGESAGGYAVNLLMISPAARGLFHRAICESGLGRGPRVYLNRRGPGGEPAEEAAGAAFTRALGVASDDPAALRALPLARILAAGEPHSGEMVVIDGKLVPDAIDTVFARHGEAPVPYLLGYNAFEFPWATVAKSGPLAAELARSPAAEASVERAYDSPEAFDTHFISDRVFVEPARLLARLHSQSGVPTYLYRFAVLADAARSQYSEAPHASERQYVFKTLAASTWATGATDAAAAATISAYWVAFAKRGDPNGESRVPWQPYSASDDRLLEFTNDGPVVKPVPNRAVLDAIEASYRAAPGRTSETP
jgi:para-nitrobenzyl esterase